MVKTGLVEAIDSLVPLDEHLATFRGALVPTRVDLLPPRKWFRDSYSFKESIEEDINVRVGIKVDTGIGMGVEVAREDRIGDIEVG
ncbi:hypothetical protein Tco_1392605 [Tanacetum coccineum]